MGKQHNPRGQKLAAKKKRRALRATKSTTVARPAPRVELTIPMWEYLSAAQVLAERVPEMSIAGALDYMLSEPINWQNADGHVGSFMPADVVAHTGVSATDYINSLAVLHESGWLTWDANRHVHIESFPEDTLEY